MMCGMEVHQLTMDVFERGAMLGTGRVLVRRGELPEVTAGGLALPEDARAKHAGESPFGTVLHSNSEQGWMPGDLVWFHPSGGYEVRVGDETLICLMDGEVMVGWRAP